MPRQVLLKARSIGATTMAQSMMNGSWTMEEVEELIKPKPTLWAPPDHLDELSQFVTGALQGECMKVYAFREHTPRTDRFYDWRVLPFRLSPITDVYVAVIEAKRRADAMKISRRITINAKYWSSQELLEEALAQDVEEAVKCICNAYHVIEDVNECKDEECLC